VLTGAFVGVAGASGAGAFVIIPLFLFMVAFFVVVFARFWKALKRFQFNHTTFGGCQLETRFDDNLQRIVLISVLASIAALVVGFMSIGVFVATWGINPSPNNPAMRILGYLPLLCLLVFAQPYFLVNTANKIWNSAFLGKRFRFRCDQVYLDLVRITAVNWLCIIATLGLYWPWAKVRLARYRAEHLALIAHESDLDGFITERVDSEQRAIGEEVADFMDFDIAL